MSLIFPYFIRWIIFYETCRNPISSIGNKMVTREFLFAAVTLKNCNTWLAGYDWVVDVAYCKCYLTDVDLMLFSVLSLKNKAEISVDYGIDSYLIIGWN